MKRRIVGGLVGGLLGGALTAIFLPPVLDSNADAHLGAKSTSTSTFEVAWHKCPDSGTAECGILHVPIDWAEPLGETTTVAVARRPADDPDRRIGTLFFNPGGPGDGAVNYVISAEQIFSDTLRERFDIVGLDPRGTGRSVRITCSEPVITPKDTLFPRSRAQFQALRRHNRAVGRSCLAGSGELLGHTDTITLAHDHEALRMAIGANRVSWLGLSYGTQVAAIYAELYPTRTRAMVLDAALEHADPEVSQVADEMTAAEDSFNRFARWCDTSSTCALQGRHVGAVYDRLVKAADKHPIPVEGSMRPVTGEDIRMGTIRRLISKEPSVFGPEVSWSGLSEALRDTLAGDASAFALPPPDVPQDDFFTLVGIGCMEYQPQITTYAEMKQRIRMGRELAPHLQGAAEVWQVHRCIDWPLPPANPPRTLHVTRVPALIVHAVHDPSVAYKWAHTLAAQIDGSDLLTRTGDGHTSYYTSHCAQRAMDRYLMRPEAPSDRVCRG